MNSFKKNILLPPKSAIPDNIGESNTTNKYAADTANEYIVLFLAEIPKKSIVALVFAIK